MEYFARVAEESARWTYGAEWAADGALTSKRLKQRE
jgi:hypothetical protein